MFDLHEYQRQVKAITMGQHSTARAVSRRSEASEANPKMASVEEDAQAQLVAFLKQQRDLIAKLDPKIPKEFSLAFEILMRTGKSQKELAPLLGTSAPTLNRWLKGDILPENIVHRQAFLNRAGTVMSDILEIMESD